MPLTAEAPAALPLRSYMPLNADPRLLPEHPTVYFQAVRSGLARPASAGAAAGAGGAGYQLGSAISRGAAWGLSLIHI